MDFKHDILVYHLFHMIMFILSYDDYRDYHITTPSQSRKHSTYAIFSNIARIANAVTITLYSKVTM